MNPLRFALLFGALAGEAATIVFERQKGSGLNNIDFREGSEVGGALDSFGGGETANLLDVTGLERREFLRFVGAGRGVARIPGADDNVPVHEAVALVLAGDDSVDNGNAGESRCLG